MLSDRLRAALAVCVVSLLLLVGGGQAGARAATASGPGASLQYCGPGIPLVKCNESLYSKPPQDPAQAPAATVPLDTPATVSCGAGFFDAATAAALADRFGSIDCFRFVAGDRWVVFGDGMSVTSADFEAAPGGSIIAVDRCAAGDTGCLSADAVHSFADFLVTYPPAPMSKRSNLQGAGDGHLLQIFNGNCGVFTFDVDTMTWYGATAADIAALESGMALAPAFRAGPPVPGGVALTQAPPAYAGGCEMTISAGGAQ